MEVCSLDYELDKWITSNSFSIGDLNVALSVMDVSAANVFKNAAPRLALIDIIKGENLIDTRIILKTNKKEY